MPKPPSRRARKKTMKRSLMVFTAIASFALPALAPLTTLALKLFLPKEAGLSPEEVSDIAGPEALWFNAPLPELVTALLNVAIRAGSSGRPASNLRRQQWATILPQMQQAAMTIGQLRGASPFEIADRLEQMLVESVERLGDPSIDAYSFIPQTPEAPAMGMPGAAPLLPGPTGADPMQALPPAEAPVPTAAPVGGVVAPPL